MSATQNPPATRAVTAAVIARDGRYLVCQRPSHKRHGGLWEFPGGKVEAGETRADAVRRELDEELGVTAVDVGPSLWSIADTGSDFVIEFIPASIAGEPECREHSALRWATVAELSMLPLAPSDRAFVGAVLGR